MISQPKLILVLLSFFVSLTAAYECKTNAKLEVQRLVQEQISSYTIDNNSLVTFEDSVYEERQGTVSKKSLHFVAPTLDLPQSVINIIKSLTNKRESNFHPIPPIMKQKSRRELEMIVGAVDIRSDTIDYHISIAKVKGNLINHYQMMCKASSYLMSCGDFLRDYTPEELSIINTSLASFALNKLNDELSPIDSRFVKDIVSYDNYNRVSFDTQTAAIIIQSKDQAQSKSYSTITSAEAIDTKAPYSIHFNSLKGQLIVKDKDNQIVWTSPLNNQVGISPYRLVATDKGNENLLVLDSKNKPQWDLKEELFDTEFVLLQNQRYYSSNGNFFLLLQENGVLSIYKEDNETENVLVWTIGLKYGKEYISPHSFTVNSIGIAAVLNAKLESIWEISGNELTKGSYSFELTNNGILKLYDGNHNSIWSSLQYSDL